MEELRTRTCVPCKGGMPALERAEAQSLLAQVPGWMLNDTAQRISRTFKFPNYYETIGFVNAVARIANLENHHPDLEVSYGSCVVHFYTHKVKGLTENDFICAAKINALTNE